VAKFKIAQQLKKAHDRSENAIRQLRALFLKLRHAISENSKEGGASKPQVFAYRLLGERTATFLPLFKDVDVNLQKSGLKVSFKGYVSLALLTTILAFVSVIIIVPPVTLIFFHLSLLLALLYTAAATLFAGAFSIMGFYLYPIIIADNRKRNLEDSLPFTTGYLSILAGAGVPPTQMFYSLSKIDSSSAVSQEAKHIVRDVELFGVDIISAMEEASKRTPSEKFKEFLEGLIATVHSGGDLARYLGERSAQYMRLKRIALRRFGDTLGVLAEFYVVLLVAGPLMMVVMLAVMAMLGGGSLAGFSPRLLLYLLTYMGIPLGSTIFLIILDTISPKR
jgi:flagellar protein FlaJ